MTRNERGEELSPGLWLFRPGEKVTLPKGFGKVAAPEPAPGRGPLDSPAPPITRLIGRHKLTVGGG